MPSLKDNAINWLLWPTVTFAVSFIALTYGGVDHWLAGQIYEGLGHQWAWRHLPVLESGFHLIGKYVSEAAWLLCLGALIGSWREGMTDRRRALWIAVTAVLVSTTLVSVLKATTHVDCPWDLKDFGGTKQFFYLFEVDRVNLLHGRCFPAGQASSGYAWVALFFSALVWRPQWRYYGLLIGLISGFVLGVAQQLRGAHFLSHDVTTLWVCWTVAAFVYYFFTRNLAPLKVKDR